MTEEKNLQKHTLRLSAILMLLLLPLLSIIPGTAAQAAAGQQSIVDNPTYTLTSTKGSAVSTKANPDETTVLIFGHTGCSKTRATLDSITSSDWVKRSDIRVIFAETNGHTQEEVLAYEDGYQCPNMIFCYDEGYDIFQVMANYGQLYGINGGTYPMIVLIDKNNKVQNILSDKKTADEVLAEINKFADIGGGSTQPPSGSDSGMDNFAYGLKNIDGTTVSTKAVPDKTTVLLFGDTTCSFTNATLKSIHGSSWVNRQDIRVIFADVQGASLSDTKTFAQKYPDKGILFCHDESALNFNFALSYLKLINQTGGTFPYVILIDKNNKIQSITLGPQTEADILGEIEKITNQDPITTPTISNVTGLKSTSKAQSIKLTWKKISKAKGYIIYQYNSAKKKWNTKATLSRNTPSYTIKNLASGTAYRFAVKAYIQPQNSNRIISKAYTSLYTSTTPKAVNFKVTPGKRKAVIKWSKVKGASGYTVYYKTKSQKTWKKIKSTKNSSCTKTKLKSRTAYTFTVKAYKIYKGKTYTSSSSSKTVKIK